MYLVMSLTRLVTSAGSLTGESCAASGRLKQMSRSKIVLMAGSALGFNDGSGLSCNSCFGSASGTTWGLSLQLRQSSDGICAPTLGLKRAEDTAVHSSR